MLTKEETATFQRRLLKQMRRLKGDLGQLRSEALEGTGGEASGSLSNVPRHHADLASREAEEDLTLDFIGNEEHLLAECDAALTRIEQGTFGRCQACGKAIAKERLQAVPYGRNCIRCAEEREKKL